MSKLFGTDGIRAVAGEYPLDWATLYKLGRHLVRLGRRKIVIGRDTRASGVWIEDLLSRAVRSEGGEFTCVGVVTTPGIACLTRMTPFDAGIMISASHNPYQDNGIKVFSGLGVKLSDREEERLERAVFEDSEEILSVQGEPFGDQAPPRYDEAPIVETYLRFLRSVISEGSLRGMKVALDCAHGAGFRLAPRIFSELGVKVTAVGVEPDGFNINLGCGALHPCPLSRVVVESGADFGLALDGDGDRAILVDEQGRVLDGDYILYILACYLRESGDLRTACVVTTVMANMGLEAALRERGLSTVRTRVGDRYVLEEMIRGGHSLGGEQSGHIIIRPLSPAGDGIQTALKVAEILSERKQPLSCLADGLTKFPQTMVNVRVREKVDFRDIPEISDAIEQARRSLGERGRVLVRYSGTEPVARIMLEGEVENEIVGHARLIASRFEQRLGD